MKVGITFVRFLIENLQFLMVPFSRYYFFFFGELYVHILVQMDDAFYDIEKECVDSIDLHKIYVQKMCSRFSEPGLIYLQNILSAILLQMFMS